MVSFTSSDDTPGINYQLADLLLEEVDLVRRAEAAFIEVVEEAPMELNEEQFMQEIGFPSLDSHKKVHQLFAKKVEEFVARYEAGDDVTDDLLTTLNRWLINHIKNEDGEYADFNRKGPAMGLTGSS